VHKWQRGQQNTFCYDGIKKLGGRWEKYVEKADDYAEKLCFL
jgi:hypothetical protein